MSTNAYSKELIEKMMVREFRLFKLQDSLAKAFEQVELFVDPASERLGFEMILFHVFIHSKNIPLSTQLKDVIEDICFELVLKYPELEPEEKAQKLCAILYELQELKQKTNSTYEQCREFLYRRFHEEFVVAMINDTEPAEIFHVFSFNNREHKGDVNGGDEFEGT